MNFETLLSPFTRDRFIEEHLDRTYLFNKRELPEAYSEIFSTDDIEALLSFGKFGTADFRIFRNGEPVNPSNYAPIKGPSQHIQRVNPHLVNEEFRKGGTLVFESVHRSNERVHDFCRRLELDTGQRFQANIYVTPPNNEGFRPHFDGHDVFICQISGTKEWKVGCGLNEKYRRRGNRAGAFDPNCEDDLDQFTISAGDLLYIPRGQIHSAKSTNETSVHITIGMIAQTWADYLKRIVDMAADENKTLNDTLPLWGSGYNLTTDFNLAKASAVEALENADHTAVLKEIYMARTQAAHAVVSQILTDSSEKPSQNGYRVNPQILYVVSEGANSLRIDFHGIRIQLPLRVKPVLNFMLEVNDFREDDIVKFMDLESALVLITRLQGDGFLQTC